MPTREPRRWRTRDPKGRGAAPITGANCPKLISLQTNLKLSLQLLTKAASCSVTELELLDQMVRDGRAIEVENIAPLLRTIAGDDAVLQRVQRRARALLQAVKED